MDWPTLADPLIEEGHLDSFAYDQPLANGKDPCCVLSSEVIPTDVDSVQYSGVEGAIRLESDADWESWLESSISPFDRSAKIRDISGSNPSGFQLLLLSPTEGVLHETVPNPHYYLPFSKQIWKRVIQIFPLHSAICKAMWDNKTYCGFLRHHVEAESLEMFTAVMDSASSPNSLAISSTYLATRQVSLTILYTCDNAQKQRAEYFLRRSPEVANHPLLMPGLFAELQRDRLEEMVNSLNIQRDQVLSQVGLKDRTEQQAIRQVDWHVNKELRQIVIDAKITEDTIRIAKNQLSKIILYARNNGKRLSKMDRGKWRFSFHTARFQTRLDDIDRELDILMAQCRVAAEELTTAGDVFVNEFTRREAQEATRQAKTGVMLAIIASFFLPISTTSTFFATPVFDFKNNWVDLHFRPYQTSASSATTSGDNEEHVTPDSIVSGYVWVLFGTSVVLSMVTTAVTVFVTRQSTSGKRASSDSQKRPRYTAEV